MDISFNHNESTIVMLGRTGAGKSSLANKIAGEKLFPEGNTLWSQTSQSISKTISWHRDPSKKVTIVDTPGFADNRQGQNLLGDILSFLKLNGGFHIGIFCISASTRFDAHDLQELEMLGTLLGSNVFNYFFIAITQTNTLIPEHREKMFNNYPTQLPKILANHGIFSLAEERILFADFDEFEERFLMPLERILEENESFYEPEIPQQIDLNDRNSIRLFLIDPVMQVRLNREEEVFEKTRRLNEVKQNYHFFKKEKELQKHKRNQLQLNAEEISKGYQQRIEELELEIAKLKRIHSEKGRAFECQNVEYHFKSGEINNEIFQKENEVRDVMLQVGQRRLQDAGQAEINGLNQQITQINNGIQTIRNKGQEDLHHFQGKLTGVLCEISQSESWIFVKIGQLQEEINECYKENKLISAQYFGEIEEIERSIKALSEGLEKLAEEDETLQWELLLL